jgi:chaperonin GroEL
MKKSKKKISINDNSEIIEGFFTVCDAVKVSIGAEGGLGVLENDILGFPIITKDGISIARKIFSDNKKVNMGMAIAKQASARALTLSGDSTTTTLVLAQSIVNATKKDDKFFFNKKVELGINEAYKDISKKLDRLAKKVNESSVKKIAKVSANGDKDIAEIVFKAYKTVGASGLIDVQEADNPFIELKHSKGMKLSKGFYSPFLINNQNTGVFEGSDVIVIVYNGFEIHNNDAIIEFINKNKGKTILVIAERINSEDFVRDIYQINQNGWDVCMIECPEFDKKREALLEDIAIYTGGEVFIQGTSEEVIPGKLSKLLVEQNQTSFFQDKVSDKVKERVMHLKNQLTTTSDVSFFNKRIANFEGTSATILVGGNSPQETKEKFDRVEDSVCAVKSALQEGYIVGGGAALVHIASLMNNTFENKDIQFGYDLMKSAIEAPFRQICINSMRDPEEYIESSRAKYGMGYNAATDEIASLLKDGILDSKKSIKVALEQAKTSAILLMNIKVVVTL